MPDVLHFNAPDSTGCGTENDPRPPHRLSRTGQCERTALLPRLIVLWSTRKFALLHWLLFLPPLYPSPLGYFLAIRIHLLSLPVISVPARCLRRFVYSAPLLWLLFLWASGSLSLSLAFTHLRIPVSYFETQPDPLPAAPLGRDHPARAAKKCFAIKMDDLLSIMFVVVFVVKECLD